MEQSERDRNQAHPKTHKFHLERGIRGFGKKRWGTNVGKKLLVVRLLLDITKMSKDVRQQDTLQRHSFVQLE